MPSATGRSVLASLPTIGVAVVLSLIPYVRNRWIGSSTTHCYASITTLSSEVPSANCFTVSSDGLFSKVYTSSNTETTKQEGHVLPGLWDGHGHLLQYGELLHSADLFGAESMEDTLSRLRNYATENPAAGSREEWIRGIGWDQAAFGGVMPSAATLEADDVLRHKYMALDRVDVHCVWVSQAILDILPEPFPEIPGGDVVVDPGPGVFCDNAMELVMSYFPQPGKSKKQQFIRSAMKELNKVGLVGMHDAGASPDDIQLYQSMADDGEPWTLRVYAMVECGVKNVFCPETASKILRDDNMLIVRSVKLFADGALGSWGSAMIEPYADRPESSGSLLVNGTTLTSLAESWASLGYQVNIHAIGDLANRLAISAHEAALKIACPGLDAAECQSLHRYRIEHAQIIHPEDQEKMSRIGIIPSIQPTHATSDFAYAEERLGKWRIDEEAYRMQSVWNLSPVLGSDFPVEPPNPFHGMYAAISRKNPKTGLGFEGSLEGWHTEQALTLQQALEGFTLNPARASFMEGKQGTIVDGASADWIVLDEPLEDVGIEGLLSIQVRETWVGGKLVYKRSEES